jgi:hypothetical protein
VIASGKLSQRLPGFDRHLAVGFRRQAEDHFRASMALSMRGRPLPGRRA